jgi:hypothetical protein
LLQPPLPGADNRCTPEYSVLGNRRDLPTRER